MKKWKQREEFFGEVVRPPTQNFGKKSNGSRLTWSAILEIRDELIKPPKTMPKKKKMKSKPHPKPKDSIDWDF